ncbi:recombinase family protein [Sphingobium sp. ba1]|uniref:recombinase family protein n=1 Tax=Sphingobium sp. ba1 TaxID=1522072 RepID=UPI0009DEFCA9
MSRRLSGRAWRRIPPPPANAPLFGALAQFERDLIRERTNAGLKAAEARGRRGGRKPVVTPDKLARAKTHLAAGLTVREAAARVKVGKTALYQALGEPAGQVEG